MGKKLTVGDTRKCSCGDIFTLEERFQYKCLKTKGAICTLCDKPFSFVCKGATRKFCSAKCQATYASHHPATVSARQDPAVIKRKQEAFVVAMKEKYGEDVSNPSQLPHVKKLRSAQSKDIHASGHYKKKLAERFGAEVTNVSQVKEVAAKMSQANKITQNSDETKLKILTTSHPDIRHPEEWVNLDHKAWAITFQNEHGIAPTKEDLKQYFNVKSVKIPYEAKSFFRLRDSRLELLFAQVLETHGFVLNESYFRRKRFLKTSGSSLELDFFLPAHRIAFEVQDFSTHSKEDDGEASYFLARTRGVTTKKGPVYHEHKREIARRYGIDLYDVWEDEFEDWNNLTTTIGLTIFGRLIDAASVTTFSGNDLNKVERKMQQAETLEVPIKLRSDSKGWWNA